MQDQMTELEAQLRTLTNRKIDLEAQLNDAQVDLRKLKRAKDAMELDVRAKKKEIARIKVELFEMEMRNKGWDQKIFQLEEQASYTKKQLDRVVVETREAKSKLHELI